LSAIERGEFGMKKVQLIKAAKKLNVHPLIFLIEDDLDKDQLDTINKLIILMKKDADSLKAIRTLIDSEL